MRASNPLSSILSPTGRGSSLAALLLFAGACGNKEPTVIDGSSAEAFAETTEQARRDIPDADRLDYDAALKRPPGSRYGDTEVETEALAREVYNGMTAEQVLETQ